MCPPAAHRGLTPRIIAHGLASRNRNLHGTRRPFAYASQLASQSLSYMLASWGLQPLCHGSSRHGKGMCQCQLSLEGPGLSKHTQIYIRTQKNMDNIYNEFCCVVSKSNKCCVLKKTLPLTRMRNKLIFAGTIHGKDLSRYQNCPNQTNSLHMSNNTTHH